MSQSNASNQMPSCRHELSSLNISFKIKNENPNSETKRKVYSNEGSTNFPFLMVMFAHFDALILKCSKTTVLITKIGVI